MFGEDPARNDRPDILRLIEAVERLIPGVRWTQLQVSHPGADDDGIWFFWIADRPGEVQLESSNGMLPFLAETDKHDERVTCSGIEEAARLVSDWLGLRAEVPRASGTRGNSAGAAANAI